MKPPRRMRLPEFGSFVRLARQGMRAEETDVSPAQSRDIAERLLANWTDEPTPRPSQPARDSVFSVLEQALPWAAAAAVVLSVVTFVATHDRDASLESLADQLADFGHSESNGDLL